MARLLLDSCGCRSRPRGTYLSKVIHTTTNTAHSSQSLYAAMLSCAQRLRVTAHAWTIEPWHKTVYHLFTITGALLLTRLATFINVARGSPRLSSLILPWKAGIHHRPERDSFGIDFILLCICATRKHDHQVRYIMLSTGFVRIKDNTNRVYKASQQTSLWVFWKDELTSLQEPGRSLIEPRAFV